MHDRVGVAEAGFPAARISAVLTIVAVLAVAEMVTASLARLGDVARPLAVTASSCFVLIAVVGGGLRFGYGRWVLLALGLCWLGDVIGPGNFMAGLVVFLLAHFAFMGAFYTRGLATARALWTLALVLAASAGALQWLLPHVTGGDRVLVAAYAGAIGLMVVFAGGASHGRVGRVGLIAAVVFYVSDLFVARWRFVSPARVNALFCYPLYYSACILFAHSVLLERAGSHQTFWNVKECGDLRRWTGTADECPRAPSCPNKTRRP